MELQAKFAVIPLSLIEVFWRNIAIEDSIIWPRIVTSLYSLVLLTLLLLLSNSKQQLIINTKVIKSNSLFRNTQDVQGEL